MQTHTVKDKITRLHNKNFENVDIDPYYYFKIVPLFNLLWMEPT